ncbi:MAG TPA: hypothetical protein VG938_07750 [Verrucomicrobiae bacterium]|nr:hypothetical protein [Verrucomicrobiae bacterium]
MSLATMLVIPAAPLAITSCSSNSEPQTEASYPAAEKSPDLTETGRGGVVLQAAKSEFLVESVNPADRTVKLWHADGSLSTVECGPEVRNFDQIKAGDHVTATLAESLAVRLIKGDEVPTGAATTSAVIRSPEGAKPGGEVVDTVGFTAKVLSVDAARRQVTLQTADNNSEVVKVGPDIDLTNISPGDHVGVRATRAFAITVKSAEK